MAKQENSIFYILGAGILGLVTWNFIRKGRTAKNLNVSISNVDLNVKDKKASVEVRIVNPTKQSITINSFVGDFIWNGDAIGTLKFLKDQVISGQSETKLLIPVQLNPIALISFFATLFTKDKGALEGTYQVKGVLSAENLLFPVDYKSKYDFRSVEAKAKDKQVKK